MKQSESTFYDVPERKECIKLWSDVGNTDELKPGPYKGVDFSITINIISKPLRQTCCCT